MGKSMCELKEEIERLNDSCFLSQDHPDYEAWDIRREEAKRELRELGKDTAHDH